MVNRDKVLMAVLDCGTQDLSVLDDIGYDLEEIIDDLRQEGVHPTLNAITDKVFRKGACDMRDYLDELVSVTEADVQHMESEGSEEVEPERYSQVKGELEDLRRMNPEEDIGWFCNCLDTSVYFLRNEELYRKYLPDAIEEVESNMGFSF